jgi:hypothetical protein
MPYPAYRWLFIQRLKAGGYRKIAQLWPEQFPEAPAYETLVFAHESNGQFLTTTCGLGRVAQEGGTAEDGNQFIEFAVELSSHSPKIANALSLLALMVHLKKPGSAPIGRCHRASHATPFPFEWVVYDSLPDLDLGGSSPISMFQPLFMTASERGSVPLGHIHAWIEEHRAEALARWLHAN